MHTPALEYLALRGLGAPAVVVALAIQGVFRGFKDTKTPLYASSKLLSTQANSIIFSWFILTRIVEIFMCAHNIL